MKNVIVIVIMSVFALGTAQVSAQSKKGTETIEIKTSSQCGMCKETLEKAMAFEKGIVKADLNVDTQIFTIRYKTHKTSPEKIKAAIAKSGYDADDVPADKKAYDKLHYCCKKPSE